MTGKLADVVMSVRGGEQIARKYQPNVYNPSTPAQVATRARMKLMSQLSAVMAPVIAMRKVGNASSRNMFTKANFRTSTYLSGQADITLTNVKLTSSAVALSPLHAPARTEQNKIEVRLEGTSFLDVDHVVYAMFTKDAGGTLRYNGSKVVSEPADSYTFRTDFDSVTEECVFYAYGIRDNNENARALFGNMQAISAETIAKLIVTSTLTESDVTLTETRAIGLAAQA